MIVRVLFLFCFSKRTSREHVETEQGINHSLDNNNSTNNRDNKKDSIVSKGRECIVHTRDSRQDTEQDSKSQKRKKEAKEMRRESRFFSARQALD